jgi:hypothetical protein
MLQRNNESIKNIHTGKIENVTASVLLSCVVTYRVKLIITSRKEYHFDA